MRKKPVILAFFANTSTNSGQYLSKLDEESRGIQDLFLSHEIEWIPRQQTTAGDVWNYIRKFRDRLVAIHFAGHANEEEIVLLHPDTARDTASAPSIAQLLGTCPKLKLVFLNACSTAGQVDELLFKGQVPQIIATGRSIQDDIAASFALEFYSNLAEKEAPTIESAFVAAKSRVAQLDASEADKLVQSRSFERETPVEKEVWGLYTQEELGDENLLIGEDFYVQGPMHKFRWHLLFILFGLPFFAGVFLLTQEKSGVPFDLTLLASEFKIQVKSGQKLELGQQLDNLMFEGFEEIHIPADVFSLESEITVPKQKAELPDREITLRKDPFFDSRAIFHNPYVRNVGWKDSSTLRFAVLEESESSSFRMSASPGHLELQLQYADTLQGEAENFSLSAPFSESLISGGSWQAYPYKSQPLQVHMEGGTETSQVIMHGHEGQDINWKAYQIKLDKIAFDHEYEPGKIKSAILQASLSYLGADQEPMKEIQISTGQFLRLMNPDFLELMSLDMTPEGFQLQVHGQVDEVRVGISGELDAIQHPNYLQWYWHYRRLWLLLGLGIPLLLGMALLRFSGAFGTR